MKTHIVRTITAFVATFTLCGTLAYAQEQQEPPDFVELAEQLADKYQNLFDLDDYQVFYVDSTLKHDYVAMNEEMMKLQMQKVSNSSLYYAVQDKWMEAIDNSFRKIFNDKQWDLYLKSGALKMQKQREKRKEKAEKADMDLKNRQYEREN